VYQDKHVYYIGAYLPQDHELITLSDSDIKKKWFTYLHTIFPHFDENRVESTTIFKLPFAQHVVDTHYEEKILPHKIPQLPNTFIANFAQIFPQDRGTNYSIEEGQQIAKMMVQ
jgi:protoporphyrinogen oxidase